MKEHESDAVDAMNCSVVFGNYINTPDSKYILKALGYIPNISALWCLCGRVCV